MEFSIKKSKYNTSKGLDDNSLLNDGKVLSAKRSREIENMVTPNLDKAFEGLISEGLLLKKI